MLVAGTYVPTDTSEEGQARGLQLFSSWTPPSGFEFLSHYTRLTGGGLFVAETDSVGTAIAAMTPFTPYFDFEVTPVVPVEEGVEIMSGTMAFWASVE